MFTFNVRYEKDDEVVVTRGPYAGMFGRVVYPPFVTPTIFVQLTTGQLVALDVRSMRHAS